MTRSSTLHGSTPDHQVIRRLRPSFDGFAFSHLTLRGLTVWPSGLVGLGAPPVGSSRGATVWLAGSEGPPVRAVLRLTGCEGAVALGSVPQPRANRRLPARMGVAIIRIPLRRIGVPPGSGRPDVAVPHLGHDRLNRDEVIA